MHILLLYYINYMTYYINYIVLIVCVTETKLNAAKINRFVYTRYTLG